MWKIGAKRSKALTSRHVTSPIFTKLNLTSQILVNKSYPTKYLFADTVTDGQTEAVGLHLSLCSLFRKNITQEP
jgi:hypothetical protein